MNLIFEKKKLINCKGKLLNLNEPKIMGILNYTPDSFYDGGKWVDKKNMLHHVSEMIEMGADIIDIGAYSSRPFAEDVNEEDEKNRLAEVLNLVRNEYPDMIISVDTFRASIAEFVSKEFNVEIINDISAGELDDNMFQVVADNDLVYMIMHMKGTPQDMQLNPEYENISQEVIEYFIPKVTKLRKMGVRDVVIDPGFGFAKSLDHNYELLSNLNELKLFDLPILVGMSRKSMIYKLLDIDPKDALNGTSVLNLQALNRGANILRVHDVKEAVEVVKLYNQLKKYN